MTILIKSKVVRRKQPIPVGGQSNLQQMRIHRDAMSVGMRHYQSQANKTTSIPKLKMWIAEAKDKVKMSVSSFFWLKVKLTPGENPMSQWRCYGTKAAPVHIINEYKEFWDDVIDVHQKRIDKLEKKFNG